MLGNTSVPAMAESEYVAKKSIFQAPGLPPPTQLIFSFQNIRPSRRFNIEFAGTLTLAK